TAMNITDQHISYYGRWGLVLVIGWAIVGPVGAVAANEGMVSPVSPVREAQQVNLVVGKSTVVDMPVAIKRASLADPQVADAIVLSPKQIYVTGKGYGSTNLTLWGKDDQVLAVFDLDVGVDLTRLKQHLGELLPDETNLHLKGTHDHVTVSGTVSSESRLSQVLAVAEAYAPKKVLNFLKIYPEPPGSTVPPEVQTVTVEVIKGTAVNSVKF
ncbi:MAG: pilus assembly protein N-terminal domain-containing protein, partial [Nitrospirota bacterium]|nr:pilus assembly protein N-terminal domain-containing protein [Nitrospirota bacterium]